MLVNGELIGPVTLVRNGTKTIGVTDAELLRPHVGAALTVATMLDGSAIAAVGHWGLSRKSELGLIELAQPVDTGMDVRPIELGAVSGNVDTRGAPAAMVGIVRDGARFVRTHVPVVLDKDDGGDLADGVLQLASPLEDEHVGMRVEGATLWAWFPPNPALGRSGEVLVLGLAQGYRGFSKPRRHPVIAEVVGLDDLGRALLMAHKTEEREPELRQVAGEIVARAATGRTGSPKKP
ncbi:MAG TPA: hypothetical protein VHW23_23795 [Kofleriaceae bacterium]|nr:hypothetical protein [Kofleriaceae bacterium]